MRADSGYVQKPRYIFFVFHCNIASSINALEYNQEFSIIGHINSCSCLLSCKTRYNYSLFPQCLAYISLRIVFMYKSRLSHLSSCPM